MGRPPKLTPQQQKVARRQRADGATLKKLAKSYNVGRATISRLAAAEFFDRSSVPKEIADLWDEWRELDADTARLVRAAVSSRSPRQLRLAWGMLAARAELARTVR